MARFNLFGFKLGKDTPAQEVLPSFSPPVLDDGATTVAVAAHYGTTVDLESSYKSEIELITRYREMSMQPEVESAVDDIINEAIIQDNDSPAVSIKLDNLKVSPKVKSAMEDEFEDVLTLLNFKGLGQDIFKRFYVDGRLYYTIIVDEKDPKFGIKELRYVDPRKITKVREIVKQKDPKLGADLIVNYTEYYVYSEQLSSTKANLAQTGVKIAPDTIIAVSSGLLDSKRSMVLSYLHKAIKPLNNLRMIEDASVIYKVSRAPERRIFYIDVGNLPKAKAEQYLKDMMTKYKNKVVYDACLGLDTKIPLLDGRTLTLLDIILEYQDGKELWAYSCDPKTGKFVPGLISWAGITRINTQVVKVTLDNGESITCTPDHKFPVWGKGFVEAKDLISGESMIPLYTRNKTISHASNSEYLQIFKNDTKKWEFVHREVSKWKDDNNLDNEYVFNDIYSDEDKHTVHHKNYNRYDNSPSNLTRMNNLDHFDYHKQHNSEAGKIGGKRAAITQKELGVGIFGLTDEQRQEYGKKYGKLGGKQSFENKSGIHGLTLEETTNNAQKGGLAFKEKLENDPEFRSYISEMQKQSWDDNKRRGYAERALEIFDHEHFSKMNKLSNESRWNSEKTESNKRKLAESQTILYPKEIIDIIKHCAKQDLSKHDTILEINTNRHDILIAWRDLNKNQKVKNRDVTSLKFTEKDLNRITRLDNITKWEDYKESVKYRNHKIVSVEWLDETMNVGTLTIDGQEIFHDHHTFALDCGIYTKNSSGEVRDDRRHLSMQDDFWIPRRGDATTEITTLPSSSAFDDMSMVEYFEKKLYKSLSVPYSRLHDPENSYVIGREAEISRDEIKFSKFINRLRSKFTDLFDQALKTQCVLKGVCTAEEFDEYKQYIYYDFKLDNNYAELKEAELIQNRVNLLTMIDPFVGKYFSMEWVYDKVLNFTEDESKKMRKQIDQNIKDGLVPDPSTMFPGADNQMDGNQPQPAPPDRQVSGDNTSSTKGNDSDNPNPYYNQ